jgi:hypothetical protein
MVAKIMGKPGIGIKNTHCDPIEARAGALT